MNRRRQEWVEGNCSEEKKLFYCEINELNSTTIKTTITNLTSDDISTSPNPIISTQRSTQKMPHPDKVISLNHGEKISKFIKNLLFFNFSKFK